MAQIRIVELLKEARRRRIFRVAGLYIVGAWLVLQVADNAFPAFDIPAEAIRYVYFAAVSMFPIALFFGWRYDFLEGRIIRTTSTDKNEDISLNNVDYFVLSSLALVIVAVAFGFGREVFFVDPLEPDRRTKPDIGAASVAVMPFVNISAEPDYAFFGDGLAEEILNALSNVRGLHVTGRTSSFSLRDKRLSVREIGARLGVSFVLEGSVRVHQENVRTTAQLIDTDVDGHVWSKTYEHSMDNLFTIQEEIAGQVSAAISEKLAIMVDRSELAATTDDPEAYRLFLKAKDQLRNPGLASGDELQEAIFTLQGALKRDPKFSDAYVELARAYYSSAHIHYNRYRPAETRAALKLAQETAQRALELAPHSSQSLSMFAITRRDDLSSSYVASETVLKTLREAIRINPNNVNAYFPLIEASLYAGEVDEAWLLAETLHRIDPFEAQAANVLSMVLNAQGRFKEASAYRRLVSDLTQLTGDKALKPSQEYLSYVSRLPGLMLQADSKVHMSMQLQPECADDFELSNSDHVYAQDSSAKLYSLGNSVGWCNTVLAARAEPYRGQYVRLSGMLKLQDAPIGGSIWLRVDGWKFGFALSFDNLGPRFARGPNSDWKRYSATVYVPEDSYVIYYGAALFGSGTMWMDDFHLEVSDSQNF